MHKKCPKCNCIKERQEFNTNRSRNDGLSDWCRVCNGISNRANKLRNKERNRITDKLWENKNKEKRKIQKHISYLETKDHKSQYQREYRAKYKEKVNANKRKYRKTYTKQRLKNDINFRIYTNIRARIRTVLKQNKKQHRTIDLIGCTIAELKQYLESKWQPGMTWENWSHTGWHIDHIKPLASFNFSDPEQAKLANHYTNLQPLWAKDHIEKSKQDMKIIVDFRKKKC